MNSANLTILDAIEEYERTAGVDHHAQSMLRRDLEQIFAAAGTIFECSVETGCGKSTICFSNFSKKHYAFCLDDREEHNSSVNYFLNCPASNKDAVEFIFGSTQITLPKYDFQDIKFDFVFIDGPHAYPFPDLEYFFFYPHLLTGGFLVIDDVQIPSISRMCDILAEDRMYEYITLVQRKTLVLRRTSVPMLSPTGDGWGKQDYNIRRARPSIRKDDGKRRVSFLDIATT